jgi:hypothetical protein
MPLPGERLREIGRFAKSPRPGERAKSSAWATCLGVSRATAIKPDVGYVLRNNEGVKFFIVTCFVGSPCAMQVADRVSPIRREAMSDLTPRTDIK